MKMVYGMAAGAAAVGGLCLLRSEYEKNFLATDRYVIHSPKIHGQGKTFVFLTDLHDKEFGSGNRRLLSAIRAEKPDAVLVGGDMLVAKGEGDLTVSLALLRALAAEFPVYCGNGNHECRVRRETHVYHTKYQEYRQALKEAGVVYLADANVSLGEDFVLYGLDLAPDHYRERKPKMAADFVEKKLGAAPKEQFSILLAHSPLFFEEYAAWGADLVLSGHFHGGTIRLPFLGGVMTPQYQFFYPRCAGIFKENESRMIVGRGLGTHSVNIRFNNKPQVVVVKIEK